jgi:hypothetical protein
VPRPEDTFAYWRDALQLLPLADEANGQPGTHLRVLFRPAFHNPACLTLHLQEPASSLECILPDPSVWDWVRQASRARDPAPVPALAVAALSWMVAPVPRAVEEQFQSAVAGIAITGLGDTRPGEGRDGLLIDGEFVVEGVAGAFAAWSPTAAGEPAVYRVCMAVLDLGRACLPDEPSQTALSNIQRYLHPG